MSVVPVLARDFRVDRFDLTNDFAFFPIPNDGVANDGKFKQNNKFGLVVTAKPYLTRGVGIFDHTKWLVLTQASILTNKSTVVAELVYSFSPLDLSSPGLEKYYPGIVNIVDDPRITSGLFNMIDPDTFMVFDFVLSGQRIYALYEHLPLNNATATFTQMIPVGTRPLNQSTVQTFRITFNGEKQEAQWLIDGVVVLTVGSIGLPIPNPDDFATLQGDNFKKVKVNSLTAGFGLFTILDFFLPGPDTIPLTPLDPTVVYFQKERNFCGQLQPQTEFAFCGDQEIDGQGGQLRVQSILFGTLESHPVVIRNPMIKKNRS